MLAERPDLEIGLGKLVGEEAEARDASRPAPVRGLDTEDVDLESVAGLGGGDVHGAVDLVELGEEEGGDAAHGGLGGDLAVGSVETIKGDGVTRRDAQNGGDARWN